MVSNNDKWKRIFDVPDSTKHKQGFTIYKIVSLLYPESCPDAVTKVTVWKRFNEFKKLHRELKVLHRNYNHKTKFPSLPNRTLFKRFDSQTIAERKAGIQHLLDYIGSNQQLFTSNEFVKFLETSHTPVEQLTSNINNIRADLNLPYNTDDTNHTMNSDDEETISDSDSITTMSSLGLSVQNDHLSGAINSRISHTKMWKLNSTISVNSQSSSKNSDSSSMSTILEGSILLYEHIFPTPSGTPQSALLEEHIQYIIDASLHIKLAFELENDKKYEEAFCAYKTAVDILLKYGKDDANYERKKMVCYKIEKYLIKAEKIYNMHLAPEVKDLQVHESEAEVHEVINIKRPLFDLCKYKVVKIISRGMLVLHTETQRLFYIKVVHKTVTSPKNNDLILSDNVPFMVRLYSYHNCDNAWFLILEYCSGTNLREYLKIQSMTNNLRKNSQILLQIEDLSDNDSELSFSDLNEYITNICKDRNIGNNDSSDDTFEKVEISDPPPLNKEFIENFEDLPLKKYDTEDLLSESQEQIFAEKITKQDQRGSNKKESFNEGINQKESIKVNIEDFDTNLLLPEHTVVKWAAQLLLALDKLHALGVVCRDLHMNNLMVDETDNLTLTYMCNLNELGDVYCNRIDHNLAPEVYSFEEITAAADWWSYGAILYELLVGMVTIRRHRCSRAPIRTPTTSPLPATRTVSPTTSEHHIVAKLTESKEFHLPPGNEQQFSQSISDVHTNGVTRFSQLKIPKYVSPKGRSLLKQLLIYEPDNRLGSGINGTENIKSHPFFSTVSWNSFLCQFNLSDI